jgi:hypothetical protein
MTFTKGDRVVVHGKDGGLTTQTGTIHGDRPQSSPLDAETWAVLLDGDGGQITVEAKFLQKIHPEG